HGDQAYRPSPRAASVLKASFKILQQYEAWDNPMTARQIFYRLVQEYNYDKTERDYKSLVGWIARSRRARQGLILERIYEHEESREDAEHFAFEDRTLIPFPWIRDEKGYQFDPLVHEDRDD